MLGVKSHGLVTSQPGTFGGWQVTEASIGVT